LKGVALAIRAVAALPGWKLTICGGGPDEARLRSLCHRLGTGDRVEFRGWVRRNDLIRILRQEASVFLFPSLRDEAGWAVAEARQMGLPIVCLRHGGPPLVAGPAGWAVTPQGSTKTVVAAISGALRQLEDAPDLGPEALADEMLFDRRCADLASLLQGPMKRLRVDIPDAP
jgi:glycosyltransferase involved in cell wall biosynthesis